MLWPYPLERSRPIVCHPPFRPHCQPTQAPLAFMGGARRDAGKGWFQAAYPGELRERRFSLSRSQRTLPHAL